MAESQRHHGGKFNNFMGHEENFGGREVTLVEEEAMVVEMVGGGFGGRREGDDGYNEGGNVGVGNCGASGNYNDL